MAVISLTRRSTVEKRLRCAPCRQKCCHSKSLEIIRTYTVEFLFVFHCNYGHILYCFRDKARYWLKIAIFLPFLRNNPLQKKRLRIFPSCFVFATSQILGLSCGVEKLYKKRFCKKSSVYSQLQRVTDNQTDRQSDGQTKSDINRAKRLLYVTLAIKVNEMLE